MILRVAVSNVVELELAIESHEPASEPEEKFGERRVHVKVVLSRDVVGGEFSKVDFIEAYKAVSKKSILMRETYIHYLVGMIDLVET